MPARTDRENLDKPFAKCPTGIKGLDDITFGGLPKGRPTLVCGGAGAGKTLLAIEFLVRGATEYGEPGVMMTFEESGEELAQNVASLGFRIGDLVRRKMLFIDSVRVDRSEIEETGEYDLDGLFVRLGHAIDTIGAKRVAMDSIETLFSGLSNQAILRAELKRLFNWLKEKGMTAVITGERGTDTLTRHGLEEYISDCVIFLDHRAVSQISTRRLRIIKYRGSAHGTNEFPFLIGESGLMILPITSLGLKHVVTDERVSTGVPRLDTMLGGKGLFRGSTALVSGTAGTGKTSIAAHFADAACRRGERCLFFAFEESASQLIRNMRSIGIDLGRWAKKDLLRFHAERPTIAGLEAHLSTVQGMIQDFKPNVVVMDPISNLVSVGTEADVKSMLIRVIDHMKMEGITALLTSLTAAGADSLEETSVGISSLADTWLLLRDIEIGGERNRGVFILKSRGMAHSNQIREFLLTDDGIDLVDVYVGPAGVLTGSARLSQEATEKEAAVKRVEEATAQISALESKRKLTEAKISALRAEFEAEEASARRAAEWERTQQKRSDEERAEMAAKRKADRVARTGEKRRSR